MTSFKSAQLIADSKDADIPLWSGKVVFQEKLLSSITPIGRV